ncbi:polypeptide N-acetylgalactosaminyltransferase 5-like [Haliotis rufescens]|uniref:polypeptide N-acetylgalactosaminyltransferase 5-like n=1 Tax=Haliotis rufescens TaxID=6454 RepID=UPI00201F28AE|nr:polypeptide N-acetylgalactosaminyltransferase 5-like [Haliotis rufescens]XP_046378159.2 polypeptide N-acetylgalactosaminyltransferase 5-like [Haliotis rufescens]
MRRSTLNIIRVSCMLFSIVFTARILMQIFGQHKRNDKVIGVHNSPRLHVDAAVADMKDDEEDESHTQGDVKSNANWLDQSRQAIVPERTNESNHKKEELSDKAAEQLGLYTHKTHNVEYYVDWYGGENSNVTYPPFVEHSPENGPGEWGAVYNYKHTKEEEGEYKEGKKRNGFNQLVSDRISVHRRLPDSRLEECKSISYPADLPPASVIICFHNEAWSTLLRSVHSVLDRSPAHLIREINLVDDASTQDHLKASLKTYMSKLGKVKIVRHREHQGLIRARLTGYEVAAGPVLVFLDSHIECYPGWLEPLLDRIRQNPKNVPFPMVDNIGYETFHTYIMNTTNRLGVFTWKQFIFNWGYVKDARKSQLKTPTDPIRSPTMPGGLFAIDRQWFTTLGTYDPELMFWGSENLELSFKIWMCNGTLETLPCSHVGHVFRLVNPIKWKEGGVPAMINAIRVAEVWLDEYKYLYYEANRFQRVKNYGDITDRQKLRERLHCHNFRWYIKNIYPECPIVKVLNAGEIRSVSHPSLCVSATRRDGTSLRPCHGYGRGQYWQLFPVGVLQGHTNRRLCVRRGEITDNRCYQDDMMNWTYTEDKTLHLRKSDKCLTAGDNSTLLVKTCDGTAKQRWMFEKSKFPLHDT